VTELVELLQTFKFEVRLTRSDQGATGSTLGTGGFAECSGLELEADVKEYLEGGRNDGVVRRVGRAKLSPIVLKRGMFRRLPAEDEPGMPVPSECRSDADSTADARFTMRTLREFSDRLQAACGHSEGC